MEPEQRRILGFIQACNRSGYQPTREEAELWLDSPTARPGGVTADEVQQMMVGDREDVHSAFAVGKIPGRKILDHVIRIRWVVGENLLRLTALGQALLMDSDRMDDLEEASVVVLKSEDQLAYSRLVGELARTGRSFLVDPYFRLDHFKVVAESTDISRILISKQYKGGKEARAALGVALGTLAGPRSIEIRATSSLSLHDRIVVAENGEVFSLGASLNGIGVVTTVYMPLPAAAAASMKEAAEAWWESGDLVGPNPEPDRDAGSN